MSEQTIREFILVANATAAECCAAQHYLTDHEGDDISISVRPWGKPGQVEGLFEIVNGQRVPASLQHDKDQSLEERIADLTRAAWEHAATVVAGQLRTMTISEVLAHMPGSADWSIVNIHEARVTAPDGRKGLVYWDTQDPANEGWAYQLRGCHDPERPEWPGLPEESGELNTVAGLDNVFG